MDICAKCKEAKGMLFHCVWYKGLHIMRRNKMICDNIFPKFSLELIGMCPLGFSCVEVQALLVALHSKYYVFQFVFRSSDLGMNQFLSKAVLESKVHWIIILGLVRVPRPCAVPQVHGTARESHLHRTRLSCTPALKRQRTLFLDQEDI